MSWVHLDPDTHLHTDALVLVDFKADGSAFGEHADLIVIAGDRLVDAGEPISTIAGLQQLRELVRGGAGSASWVLVRTPGTTGDTQNSFVNLHCVARVEFATAPDGPVARVTATNGTVVGEVHQPAALQRLRDVVKT
jgi:hypothetical protein